MALPRWPTREHHPLLHDHWPVLPRLVLWVAEEAVRNTYENKKVIIMYMYTYRYRRTKVGSLADLARTVNSSATVNVAQAVGSMDGTVHVPVYDWASYLGERLQKLPRIKSLHHLRFSKDHPGHVFVKERSDSPEIDHDLLKDVWSLAATSR